MYTESLLIQIELLYNNLLNFSFFKTENTNLLIYIYILYFYDGFCISSYVYKSFTIIYIIYVKWDQKDEMGRNLIMYICGENNNVENKTGILYNDTVEKLKGCSAAW